MCRVLVVEDDAVSCQAMRALLVRWGHEVATCATVAEATADLSDHYYPDCLILDLMLPDENGVELLRRIRRRELPVKVAVVTAAFDPKLLRDVRELRPDVFFQKPVDVARLKRWLISVSEHSGEE